MADSASIQTRHYLTCLWPGLTQLWWRGQLSSLPAAIVFAVALNLLLIVRFMFPQWLSGWLVTMACVIAGATWIFYVIRSVKELPKLLVPREVSEKPDHFDEAQVAFLRADWVAAEEFLMDVLAIEPRDPPALLMLSSVYRHTDRIESARMVTMELGRLDIGDAWALEIEAELQRVERDGSPTDEADETEQHDSEAGKKGEHDRQDENVRGGTQSSQKKRTDFGAKESSRPGRENDGYDSADLAAA